jgi:hypothetical protein
LRGIGSRQPSFHSSRESSGARCRGSLCLSFLNLGGGAHGTSVPEDAQPPDRRRRAFQFYMGPDREQLDPIIARLPPDRQRAWTRRVKHEERSALRKAAAGRPS